MENKLVLEKELVDDFLDLSGISRDDITYKASHFGATRPSKTTFKTKDFI